MKRQCIYFFYFTCLFASFFSCKKREPEIVEIPPKIDFWEYTAKSFDSAKRYDIVIYGGTPAGIMAAIEGSRNGRSVLLINHSEGALGGMLSNGLGNTDVLGYDIIGGLSQEFFTKIREYYNNESSWFVKNVPKYGFDEGRGGLMLKFEPRAAQSVFRDFLASNSIPVLHRDRLQLTHGVVKANGAIDYIIMESGKRIKGDVYIDASYEGDLMACAGVSYSIGREANSVYGETFNGTRLMSQSSRHQIPDGVSAEGLPIENKNVNPNGVGDKKVQAYCYRMCLTDVEDNKVPFSKPLNYDEKDYELLFRYLSVYKDVPFFDLNLMPNRKTDSNNSGPISTDFVGENYDYPDGNYNQREIIRNKHKTYQMGLMWTLANNPRVPEKIRNQTQKWGLAKDEFVNNGNWPLQLYIREARRMKGEYIMTENNCNGKIIAEQSIALADYPMDSHIVQRFANSKGFVKNEGQIMAPVVSSYKIDMRSLFPKPSECSNLIVPVCISASHIAYGSLRMEPVFMTLGQVSGLIASISIEQRKLVSSLSYDTIKEKLISKNIKF